MYQELFSKLKEFNQEHLLSFWNEIDDSGKKQLAGQLNDINWNQLADLIKTCVLNKPEVEVPDDLVPAPYFPLNPPDELYKKLYSKAVAKGVELIASGKVSALTVAGGQGTRLGFDGPKGTFPITPVKNKTLFQYFAESIQRANEKYSTDITWYIMTSVLNNKPTVDFFTENNFFGLKEDKVVFFVQGTMPAVGTDGKLLLVGKDSLALSPDGHGGTLLALRKSGALDRMKSEGVEHISYFQVDNPLVSVVNPLFIGLHHLEESEASAIMLSKTGPFEKLGNFCISKGRLEIIEYSDMPDELAEQRDENGRLKFIAGSPAIHVLSRVFVERLTEGGTLNMPWHRADKKVPYIDMNGNFVKPEDINAVKLESFIFDALPLANKTMVLEGKREDEFAPTKNKMGVDSVESCREMLIDRDSRWLESAGVNVPRDGEGGVEANIELSPRSYIDSDDVMEYVKNSGTFNIEKGSAFYIE